MATIKNGSKKRSLLPIEPSLSAAEAQGLIQLLTVGADAHAMGDYMAAWPQAKQTEAWQIVADYFRQCAEFNPKLEKGKAIARLNLLFKNSMTIQDFSAGLAIQKEINKLMRLYVG
jgi:hypothetical protein